MGLVRVRKDDREWNVGEAFAEANKLDVIDEPTRFNDGALRPATRREGRPVKPKTSVAKAAEKKAAQNSAANTTPPSEEN